MTDLQNNRKKTAKAPVEPDLRVHYLTLGFGLLSGVFIVRPGGGPAAFAGGVVAACMLLLILYRDVMRYKPGYTRKFSMLVLLGMLVVGALATGRLSDYLLSGMMRGLDVAHHGAVAYAIPVAAFAMLVTLLFDFHTTLIFSFTLSLLTGLWLEGAAFAVYFFVGSMAASFGVIRSRKRTTVLVGGGYVLLSNLLLVLALHLFSGAAYQALPLALVFAVFSAFFVVAIVSLMLPVLEYLFKVTTDITLLEFLDLDQPLMKSLMINAPGTYHHSVIVGNLVESASEAVDVNPLLARVSAYYHDVGKIKMPEYFVENLSYGENKHTKLTPHMSSMILVSHVKEGVELAQHHKLPESVIDIIMQHHGTNLITYFYQKAKDQGQLNDLSEDEYKYPGPKPQTRVSALVMMADAVEASSRVLSDPTPQRITALVDKIINHIFLEGQLDECELTLKDIYEIKRRFTRILTGILHRRIDYPGFDFNGKDKDSNGSDKQPAKENKNGHKPAKEGLHESPPPAPAAKG